MPVSEPNKQYNKHKDQWQLVRDCVEGSQAIKKARSAVSGDNSGYLLSLEGSKYLPVPDPMNTTRENILRYQDYVTRANYVNFVGNTLTAYMGMVNRVDHSIDLDGLEPMRLNADGRGNSIDDIISDTIQEVCITGGQGLLAEYPVFNEPLNRRQALNVFPFIRSYCCENIINIRTKIVNSITVLSTVVLKETYQVDKDEFTSEDKTCYLVLFLDDNGVYTQVKFNEEDEPIPFNDDQYYLQPKKYDGSTFNYIPFVLVGALNNDYRFDKSPLLDLANINIAHYRNSADYEDSCYITGQPTPVFTGLTKQWYDDVLEGSIQLGSRAFVPLPTGASAQLLQANPNNMAMEGMRHKEGQMVKLGAKVIEDRAGNETAEGAKIRFAGQNSQLGTIVKNIEKAFLKIITYCNEFSNLPANITMDLNKTFYDKTVDPQMIMAQVNLLDRGIISLTQTRQNLRKVSVIDEEKTDEEIQQEIEQESPIISTQSLLNG